MKKLIYILAGLLLFANLAQASVVDEINAVREANGLQKVQTVEMINLASKIRAIQASCHFSHYVYERLAFLDVLDRLGVKRVMAGEVLAKGYTKDESIVNAWMNSPTHKDVILNSVYNKIGIGQYENGKLYTAVILTD